MSKLTYKVSYYVLYAMFALIVIVLGLFYFGGQMETPLVYDMIILQTQMPCCT